ncbi:MAG TPA: HDOD domain-containing protein [Phycisphaerae bacterium]|jgi:putative nucleotidyltransferase with HDIG domain|nr:HDOD domain-containing protein [Phycisphaerae bacterium]
MSQSSPNPEDIKTRKVELVLQQLDALPTLPAIVVRLLSLTNSNDSRIQEVVQLLSADQSLTGKLLSLAGSASAGVRVPVTNVQQAVVLLGFETVRNLALSVKVFETFQAPQAADGEEPVFKREEFWKHSLAVATAAEMLAARAKPKLNVGDAFVCGLLHDIGKVAFDTAMPKSFAKIVETAALTRGDIADVERRLVGVDHALAGKRLGEAWNLPQVITQTIWMHGAPPPPSLAATTPGATGIKHLGMVLLIGLADMLVRRQHIGFSGNYLFPYDIEQYTRLLGLTEEDADQVTAQLAEALEARARAIGLYDMESRQVYLEAIANANAELGRLNDQLRVQNRKLTARSNCFELMTRFYQRIVPAATPAQLLTEIGNVAHPFLEAGRLVVFSQDPDQSAVESAGEIRGTGEVLLFDPSKPVHDSFLMQMPAYGGDQRVGRANQNFTRPASPQADWLLERVRGFLGTNQCWFMPLLCGHEPVGGIVWAAKDGTAGTPGSLAGVSDMIMVSQAWGMTLRAAQLREQQTVLTESLAAANRELGSMQQQRVREKSLANLGEMAAGAAHEMNNPLMVISGRAQLLSAKITDAGMKGEASLIAQQADRLSQIITDMMEFAKPLTPKMTALDVVPMMEEAAKQASERAGGAGGVKVKVEAASAVPQVRGDAKQLRNALAEIILNAIQASRAAHEAEGGKRAHDDIHVHASHDPLDGRVIIQITDRGIGMSQDVAKNAFAPFFSAKAAGRNRGMGLAKALRWVENHGGTIRLDSTPGHGTTAVLILPVNGTGAAEPEPVAAASRH